MKNKHLLASVIISAATFASAKSFVTDGNAIRNSVLAKHGDKSVFYFSELDGAISCYTKDGQKIWRNPTNDPALLFEINAADFDNDGSDELVTASGNGKIDCWNSDGTLRWSFSPENKVRFNEIATIEQNGEMTVFAGGNDRLLYQLDQNGKLVKTFDVGSTIRKIEIGDFLVDGEPLLFLMTLKHDKSGWDRFEFRDPQNPEKVIKSLSSKNRAANLKGIITDLRVQDLNDDGLDDLLLGLDSTADFVALDGDFKMFANFSGAKFAKNTKGYKQRYAHSTVISLKPVRDEILLQFGRAFYVLDSNGKIIDWSGDTSARFPIASFAFDPENKKLWGAGSIGGDNAVYEFDLTKDDWWKQNIEPIGRLAEVTENIEELYEQVLDFTPPAYQKPATKPWIMSYEGETPTMRPDNDFNKIIYLKQETWSEKYDRKEIIAAVGEQYGKKIDKRKSYDLTKADLVAKASEFEKTNQPFLIWAGHGSDPFYISIDSLEAILEAAPTTCHGFIYAEMANTEDPRITYFIEEYLPRLAAACRKSKSAKLHFRYKQTFWVTTVYAQPWREMFLSGKYADILVPATEDTNSITQDLNLAGRVGLFASGLVDDFGMRLIDDNPTGWRPLAPCRQKTISPYLRSGIVRAAYGARYGINRNFTGENGPGLEVLMALMNSGVLPVIEKPEQIASISSWLLIDQIPDAFQKKQHVSHSIDKYDVSDANAIFSTTQTHWGGASIPSYDFSNAALGVKYRWTNFIPALPYGMVPIAPVEEKDHISAQTPFAVCNAESGILDGKKIDAKNFESYLKNVVQSGAEKMPVIVSGASWSAIWIDETHLRVIMLDPHYLDPRDVSAELTFQGKNPSKIMDILSKKSVSANGNKCVIDVPAGSIRVLDLTY